MWIPSNVSCIANPLSWKHAPEPEPGARRRLPLTVTRLEPMMSNVAVTESHGAAVRTMTLNPWMVTSSTRLTSTMYVAVWNASSELGDLMVAPNGSELLSVRPSRSPSMATCST